MKNNLSPESQEQFENVVRGFNTAIKNNVLYDSRHPLLISSIKVLKDALEKWFLLNEILDIGFSPEGILINGELFQRKNKIYSEITEYLHVRGIVAISILREIAESELISFFESIKDDAQIIRNEGGIADKIKDIENIIIKEIDYSEILASSGSGKILQDKEIWESLTEITDEVRKGVLPESKAEFLIDFLKDHNTSSRVLNGVYKEAMAELSEDAVAKNINEAIASICKYFEKNSSTEEEIKEIKMNIANVVQRLHPDLVVRLFERVVSKENDFDFADQITRELSDEFIADFIENLVDKNEGFNDKLLKVFDKLLPDDNSLDSVASLISERLFLEGMDDAEALSKLQLSIKDVFSEHPDNKFMSQMYRITVDTFVNQEAERFFFVESLKPLMNDFEKIMEKDYNEIERKDLFLNILCYEKEPEEFIKFSDKLLDRFNNILEKEDLKLVKEMFTFFKSKKDGKEDPDEIKKIAEKVLNKMSEDSHIRRILEIVKDANDDEIADIGEIVNVVGDEAIEMMFDIFTDEPDQMARNKMIRLIVQVGEGALKNIEEFLKNKNPFIIKDIVRIYKKINPELSHDFVYRVIKIHGEKVLSEALNDFVVQNFEEEESIVNIIKRTKDENVKKMAIASIVKTKDKEVITRLFKMSEKKLDLLKNTIEVCGKMRIIESFKNIEKVFSLQSLFNKDKIDDVKVAAVVSLGLFNTANAIELIENRIKDRSGKVSKMCEIVLNIKKR